MKFIRPQYFVRVITVLLVALLVTSWPLQTRNVVRADDAFPDPVTNVKTYEWTLSAAKEPLPALKYKLLYDIADSIPGNAAIYYTRAILLKDQLPRQSAEQQERQSEWYELPLDKLPRDELRQFLEARSWVLAELQTAAQCESCDWGVRFQDLRGPSVLEVRLPEFQETRNLTRILWLKARLEIAERRYGEALPTIRQIYQLARHVASSPALIANLIAIATQSVANDLLGEFLASQDSPNLYWALRTLPDPLVDVRLASRLESSSAFRLFPFLKDADVAQRSGEEWSRLLTDVIVSLDEHPNRSGADHLATRLQVAAMISLSYPQAKRELVAAGFDETRIEQMPVGQVVAIYARECFQHTMDESLKWMYVPLAEGRDRANIALEKLVEEGYLQRGNGVTPLRDPLLINSRLSYSVAHIREASNRQRHLAAALTAIEAIRMHAAENGDKLPGALSEITVVPVPPNPTTGKPFLYRVVDQRAELLILPSHAGDQYSGRRFLLRMR